MTTERTCTRGDGPELAERYVARALSPAEETAFEDHFVACADCQSAVRFASAVRAGIGTGESASGSTGASKVRGAARRPRRFIAIAATLAAGIGAILLMPPSTSATLIQLGDVLEPPRYAGVAVRGSPGRADSIFDVAMNAYAARDFTGAAKALRAALAAGQDSVPTEFFLGASLLMSNDAREAATAFGHVIVKGRTPYLDEARLYEAKALLRLGRGSDALEVLGRKESEDPAFAATLAALSDSVVRALARHPPSAP